MKFVGNQPEKVPPPLFHLHKGKLQLTVLLMAVGLILIYKLLNQMNKRPAVKDRGQQSSVTSSGLPSPPGYSIEMAADHPPRYSFKNVVFEDLPPSYNDVINTTRTVIN